MIVEYWPTRTTTVTHTCPYHQRFPGKPYAGCTCSAAISQVRVPRKDWTPEERRAYEEQYRWRDAPIVAKEGE